MHTKSSKQQSLITSPSFVTDPYSPLLLLAVVSVAASGLAAILRLLKLVTLPPVIATYTAIAALLLALAAVGFHLVLSHGPGSPEPMEAARFASVHPAPFIVLAVALSLLGLTRLP